jgi:hypothetical protein
MARYTGSSPQQDEVNRCEGRISANNGKESALTPCIPIDGAIDMLRITPELAKRCTAARIGSGYWSSAGSGRCRGESGRRSVVEALIADIPGADWVDSSIVRLTRLILS